MYIFLLLALFKKVGGSGLPAEALAQAGQKGGKMCGCKGKNYKHTPAL
jgi:hypothetical protein